MKALALFLALLVALLALPLLLGKPGEQASTQPAAGRPWEIEVQANGDTRVFGLVPGKSPLSEARGILGEETALALIFSPGGKAAVEAYFESVQAGGVMGKVILTCETSESRRDEILARGRRVERLESGARKVELGEEDRRQVQEARIEAITFIPSANLDEAIILQRFGTPAERLRSSETTEHFLYPERGLELRLDRRGKEVLQYVAPQEFARLRDPLRRIARP